MPTQITAALISALTVLLVASASAWWALPRMRRERAFDRRREWHERTIETIAEFYHHVSVYWQQSSPGPHHPAIVEMHNSMMAAAAPIIRLSFVSPLYGSKRTVAALDALHNDTAEVMTYLDSLRREEQDDALKHLRKRILYATDVLTASYRRELWLPALPPRLSESDRKALADWKLRKPNPDYSM